jgi:hypothetical protein
MSLFYAQISITILSGLFILWNRKNEFGHLEVFENKLIIIFQSSTEEIDLDLIEYILRTEESFLWIHLPNQFISVKVLEEENQNKLDMFLETISSQVKIRNSQID